MDKIIGFIGSGNMGSAIIGGIIGGGYAKPENILVFDLNKNGLLELNKKYGVKSAESNTELAKKADILFLAVKPNVCPTVIKEIRDIIKENTLVVSIAAGQSLEKIENMFGKEVKLVRVMPNTPALVGEGMAAICHNALVSDEEAKEVVNIFNCFGKAEQVGEYLMDTVTAVSGSSPAYVFMFIEALADGAVAGGMPRAQAYKFAAQSVLGSAKMVLETGMHPGVLKDNVCSPGGTTIDAVAQLEKSGFRNAVMEAVRVCKEKSQKL